MILDVGCGVKPRGHVNTDIQAWENPEVTQSDSVRMDPHTIPNFVVCSGEYLPFQDRVFERVWSHHVIEHVRDPGLFLRECKRVSWFRTTIVCPHRYGPGAWGKRVPYHRHVFSSRSWLQSGFSTKKISKYFCLPSVFAPLIRIPQEWTVEFYRRR